MISSILKQYVLLNERYADEEEELRLAEEEKKEAEKEEELASLDKMGEEEACALYNADSKEEARQYILDYYLMI